MFKKIILAAILVGAGVTGAMAQQLPHYTQYLLNDYAINPAVGGSTPYWEAKSNNRYQWVGVVDAPRTYILSVQGPTNNRKMGIGGSLFTDITGPTRRTGVRLSYAYHLKLNEKMKLSLGASGGALQFLIDGSKIVFREDGDIALSSGIQSVTVPDAAAGVYLYSDRFFVSVSAPQLLTYKLQFFEDYDQTDSRLARHFFGAAGYKFALSDDFDLQPAAMVKYVDPVPVQAELTLRAIYRDAIWAGASYRTESAIGIMVGYTFQQNLTLGYSYDFISNNLNRFSTGSHELMLSVKFKKRKTTRAAAATTSGSAAPVE